MRSRCCMPPELPRPASCTEVQHGSRAERRSVTICWTAAERRRACAGQGARPCGGAQVPGEAVQEHHGRLPDRDVARRAHGPVGVPPQRSPHRCPSASLPAAALPGQAAACASCTAVLARAPPGTLTACLQLAPAAGHQLRWSDRPAPQLPAPCVWWAPMWPGAGMCDADVDSVCGKVNTPRSRGVWSIGVVGRCLSRQLAEGKKLQPDCKRLITVAAPRDTQVGGPSSQSSLAACCTRA